MIYSITEGQQAEEYKARKAKEAEDLRTKGRLHTDDGIGSFASGLYVGDKNPILGRPTPDNKIKFDRKDMKRKEDAMNIVRDEYLRRNKLGDNGQKSNISAPYFGIAVDAANRHMRRHPNQYKESCGIFSSVAFI